MENSTNQTNPTNTTSSSNYAIPIAIITAGVLVAGAIFITRGSGNIPSPTASVGGQQNSGSTENMIEVTQDDHIRGNPDAPVKIVEFSDLECPFCKQFHSTMQGIVDEYEGRVAWVYRHFPLAQVHPKAVDAAVASECAWELGGPPGSEASNDAFWAYLDRYFKVTPSNNAINLSQLPVIAQEIGLDRPQFEACLTSGRYDNKIQSDYNDAIDSGGSGTPYSIVVAPNGKKFPVLGAQPYNEVKRVVEQALAEK